MLISYERAGQELVAAVPEFKPTYDEHLQDFDGEVLLHLLLADLARFAVAAQLEGNVELVDRVLDAAERLLVDGDKKTENAVAVSFVEYLSAENEVGEDAVVARFPQALAAELKPARSRGLTRLRMMRRSRLRSPFPPRSTCWSCSPS